jgi:hypothetical protein
MMRPPGGNRRPVFRVPHCIKRMRQRPVLQPAPIRPPAGMCAWRSNESIGGATITDGFGCWDEGSTLGPLDWTVTYTDKPTSPTGVLQDRSGRAATDYYILVFSSDREHWTPGSRRVRMSGGAERQRCARQQRQRRHRHVGAEGAPGGPGRSHPRRLAGAATEDSHIWNPA